MSETMSCKQEKTVETQNIRKRNTIIWRKSKELLYYFYVGNLILQLTAAVVNLVKITTNRTQAIAIRALNASRKRLKRHLKTIKWKTSEETEYGVDQVEQIFGGRTF